MIAVEPQSRVLRHLAPVDSLVETLGADRVCETKAGNRAEDPGQASSRASTGATAGWWRDYDWQPTEVAMSSSKDYEVIVFVGGARGEPARRRWAPADYTSRWCRRRPSQWTRRSMSA